MEADNIFRYHAKNYWYVNITIANNNKNILISFFDITSTLYKIWR
jgi:hypothetical protein